MCLKNNKSYLFLSEENHLKNTLYLFVTFVVKQVSIKNALYHTVNVYKNVSGGRDQTYDQLINSQLLYR